MSNRLCALWLADFINDFWELRHELLAKKSNTIHHLLGIALVGIGMGALPKQLEWLTAPFLLLEGSTIFLNNMWFLRAFRNESSLLQPISVASFVILFFSLRVVGLPAFIYEARKKQPTLFATLGNTITSCLYGITGLQWYWFVKITKKFGPQLLSMFAAK